MRVKIIEIPEGEAPEWVRKEWVGLTLESEEGTYDCKQMGVVSLEDINPSRHIHVPDGAAIKVLAAKSASAAAWFRRRIPPGINLNFRVGEVEFLS